MKTQIAAAIALSLVAGVTFAAPTFYGEIDVTDRLFTEDNASPNKDRDVVELNSNNFLIVLAYRSYRSLRMCYHNLPSMWTMAVARILSFHVIYSSAYKTRNWEH